MQTRRTRNSTGFTGSAYQDQKRRPPPLPPGVYKWNLESELRTFLLQGGGLTPEPPLQPPFYLFLIVYLVIERQRERDREKQRQREEHTQYLHAVTFVRSHKTTFRCLFSPIIWTIEIELMLPGLHASIFTHWAISAVPELPFIVTNGNRLCLSESKLRRFYTTFPHPLVLRVCDS